MRAIAGGLYVLGAAIMVSTGTTLVTLFESHAQGGGMLIAAGLLLGMWGLTWITAKDEPRP